MEDSDEPYLDGIKYHAMPPLKRFRDMEHLSGGEKTIAALALLFAIHSYQPSPFFVLDEVDAALDNANVAKIANYIREHASPGMQFIVISLKTGLFQGSEALVGIHRDQNANTSKALTLDVSNPSLLTLPGSLTLVAPEIPMKAFYAPGVARCRISKLFRSQLQTLTTCWKDVASLARCIDSAHCVSGDLRSLAVSCFQDDSLKTGSESTRHICQWWVRHET